MTGRNAFQETDVIGIATPVTKYTLQPLSAAEVPFAVKEAFYLATTGRPGPVLLDLPKDVQQEEAEMTFPDSVDGEGVQAQRPRRPSGHRARGGDDSQGREADTLGRRRGEDRRRRPAVRGARGASHGPRHHDAPGQGRLPRGPSPLARPHRDARASGGQQAGLRVRPPGRRGREVLRPLHRELRRVRPEREDNPHRRRPDRVQQEQGRRPLDTGRRQPWSSGCSSTRSRGGSRRART